jgi:uncharacterized protein YbjT (DUF2867 family)
MVSDGESPMKIVVIGGTGLIGSKVVEKLKRQGHQAVAAAPNTGVNTITGQGLSDALAGAEVVVDVTNSPSFEDGPAMDFFRTAGRNIAAAEAEAGVGHHIALSVVGTDRLQDSGYFRAKQAQEEIIRGSAIPYTIVHATQFFEFIRGIADFSMRDGAVHLPPVRFQPMAAEDVAAAVAGAALAEPVNGIIEIGGPETFGLDEAVRKVLEFDHDSRSVVTDDQAPYFGVRVSERTLVPAADARLGQTRLDWWLSHVLPPQKSVAPAVETAQS